jgi:ubiquitin-activating enzyme E1 C
MDMDFYRSFNIVVCGLDSILARRWINGLLLSMLEYDEETGALDQSTIVQLEQGLHRGAVIAVDRTQGLQQTRQ